MFNVPGSNGGSNKPYIKYNAKAGRWLRVDRTQGHDGKFVNADVDITDGMTFVADFPNMRVGWLNYPPNAAPQKVLVKNGETHPAMPGDLNAEGKPAYKGGFEFDLVLHPTVAGADNGQAREFNSTALQAIDGVREAFTAYDAAPEAKAGKLPVLKHLQSVAVKGNYGTNYKPVLGVVAWVDRPAGLGGAAAQAAPTPPPVVTPPPVPAATAFSNADFG